VEMADGIIKDLVRTGNTGGGNALTPAQFGALAEVPAELEWLANLTNAKTRRAYKIDVEEFIDFSVSAAFSRPYLRSAQLSRDNFIKAKEALDCRVTESS